MHSGKRTGRERAPAARIATLVSFFVIAAIALFADIDRTRVGTPSVTLGPDHTASSSGYVVTAAPPGNPLRRGDRVSIDDPRSERDPIRCRRRLARASGVFPRRARFRIDKGAARGTAARRVGRDIARRRHLWLRRIAFVVNRATVFGVTSLLVLAALALVEFGLEKLLGSWLLGEGIYVQLGTSRANRCNARSAS